MSPLRWALCVLVCLYSATLVAQGAPQVFVSTGTAGKIYSINTNTNVATIYEYCPHTRLLSEIVAHAPNREMRVIAVSRVGPNHIQPRRPVVGNQKAEVPWPLLAELHCASVPPKKTIVGPVAIDS